MLLYTLTSMYGRQYSDIRTRVFYTENSYTMFLDSFISDYEENGSGLSHIIGVKTVTGGGIASSILLYERKREYHPVRELNIKREMAI